MAQIWQRNIAETGDIDLRAKEHNTLNGLKFFYIYQLELIYYLDFSMSQSIVVFTNIADLSDVNCTC